MTQVDTPVRTCRAIPAMRTRISVEVLNRFTSRSDLRDIACSHVCWDDQLRVETSGCTAAVRRLATEFIPLAISMRLLIHRRSHLHAAARRVSELLRLGNPMGVAGRRKAEGWRGMKVSATPPTLGMSSRSASSSKTRHLGPSFSWSFPYRPFHLVVVRVLQRAQMAVLVPTQDLVDDSWNRKEGLRHPPGDSDAATRSKGRCSNGGHNGGFYCSTDTFYTISTYSESLDSLMARS
ncbi:hypothetical protein BHM03_00023736 [Ensete ventricosum]|nr:hypothetical protein BHM03_00023736 [Ensete ventricosum]